LIVPKGSPHAAGMNAAEPISKDEIPIAERLGVQRAKPEQLFGRWKFKRLSRITSMSLRRFSRTAFVLRKVREFQHQRDREDAEGVRRDFKREAVAGAT